MALNNLKACVKRITQTMARCAHREHQVDVYGTKLNTIQAGEGSRGVLLLPGAAGSAWVDFHKQIEGLPPLLENYRIVAWDPPGCGKSQPHPKLTEDIFVNDANAAVDLMQALNFDLFSILGWGTGGTTALVMAGRFPQFVDKLAIWGASAYFSIDELKKLDQLRGATSKCTSAKLNEKLYGTERYSELWQNYLQEVLKVIKARNGDFCKTEVECIQSPTLILHAADDPIISKQHVEYLRKHIKQAKYHEFSDGGHEFHINLDKQFNTTVATFLKE